VLHPVELERDLAVPVQPDPAERVLDLLNRLGHFTARVGVLDAQTKLAALMAGKEPVEERGMDPADVQEAGGAGREADDWGHVAIVGVVQLGAHVSSSGGIHTAIDRIEAIGGDSVQVFTQSPRAWRPTNHDPATFERFKERREEAGIDGVLCHALYLVNLASPKDDVYEKSVAALCNTVDVGCAIEADGVVFHIGSHLGAGLDEGLDRVCAALEKALDRCSDTTWLLMENSAGAGGTIGRSVGELALLYDRLDGHPRLGVCLDSCHLFVSGCDVTDPAALDAVLDELDGEIGLDRLRALHVNDSAAPLGSNRDRHANIEEGLLGKKLGVFLGNPRLQGLPAVLEVAGKDGKGPDADEIRKVKALHARATAGLTRSA
jgi:deoxyribonuclease IV